MIVTVTTANDRVGTLSLSGSIGGYPRRVDAAIGTWQALLPPARETTRARFSDESSAGTAAILDAEKT
jgi:hypothetical protein